LIQKQVDQISDEYKTIDLKIHDALRYTALSINLIKKSSRKDYDISDLTKISGYGNHPDDHRLTKKKFISWAIGNCLTDMFESFQNYLKVIISIVDNNFPSEEFNKQMNTPRRALDYKLNILAKRIQDINRSNEYLQEIDYYKINALKSIKLARNCLVHKNGVVDEETAKKSTGSRVC
jgi:hypothetical protein